MFITNGNRIFFLILLQNSKPLSWVTKESNGTLIGHGIAFEIVETLRQRYGFTYDVVVPTRETLLYENGSIVYMLIKGVKTK